MAQPAGRRDGTGAMKVEPSCSVLVLHDAELDPRPFLHRLIGNPAVALGSIRIQRDADALAYRAAGIGGSEPSDAPRTAISSSDQDGSGSTARELGASSYPEEEAIEWNIDNKYYTATVHFTPRPVSAASRQKAGYGQSEGAGEREDEVPVVMYLFTEPPSDPLPTQLTRLITSAPRDIALAVHIKPTPVGRASDRSSEPGLMPPARSGSSWSSGFAEGAFEELGMELIDEWERESDDDDNERPMDPLEQIRQTLQTHIWPNMIRKPLVTRGRRGMDVDDDVISLVASASASNSSQYSDDDYDDDEYETRVAGPAGRRGGDDDAQAGIGSVSFPISFDPNTSASLEENDDDDNDNVHDPEAELDLDLDSAELEALSNAFPSLAALRAQLPTASAPNIVSPPTQGPGSGSAYAGLVAMNAQLALANREFAQLKQEREMASERRLRRLEELERELMGERDGDDEGEGDSDAGRNVWGGVADDAGEEVISFDAGRVGPTASAPIPTAAVESFGQWRGRDAGPGHQGVRGNGPSESEWRRLEEWLSLDREQVAQMGGEGSLAGSGTAADGGPDPIAFSAHHPAPGASRSIGAEKEERTSTSSTTARHGTGPSGHVSDDEDDDAVDEWGDDAGYARLDEDDAAAMNDDDAAGGTGVASANDQDGDNDDFGEFTNAPDATLQPESTPTLGDRRGVKSASSARPMTIGDNDDDLAFEDDFTAPPISSPPVAISSPRAKTNAKPHKGQNPKSNFPPLPLDPTPLLLHLQSIRAELAGLEDEDERRTRAAKEVGGLMRSLGEEGWDEGDLDLGEGDRFEGDEEVELGRTIL